MIKFKATEITLRTQTSLEGIGKKIDGRIKQTNGQSSGRSDRARQLMFSSIY